MTEVVLGTAAEVAALQNSAKMPEESYELQGGIESLAFALERGLISLPVTLRLPSPPAPDALIISAGAIFLGIEVTRVGWRALTEVRRVAARTGDFLVETNLELLEDRPPMQARKGAPKGTFTGDFAAIRKPEEGLIGAGLLGDEARARTIDALRAALGRKSPKLAGYQESVTAVWLFLIADGLNENWQDILTRPDLAHVKEEVLALCAVSGFARVLLWRDSVMMPSNVTTLYGGIGQQRIIALDNSPI